LQNWQKTGVVKYLGRLTDVRTAIEDCMVYVLPSYYPEGTPRTILEAMAMGRPVITADAPGCRETVQEGKNGYLVPVMDAASLAQIMERFIEQPDLVQQMGQVSREIAVEKYDVRKVNSVILSAMGLS
jgi:glycosyltransferase involved in cell wall biosynthesis